MLNRSLHLVRKALKKQSRLRMALKNQSRLRRRRTVFNCIGPDGKISDEGWALLDLPNPHKRKKK